MQIMPSTRSGKLAFGLAVAFVTGYIFTFFGAQFLYKFMGMMQVILAYAFGAVGIAAGVVSLLSLFKHHERSPLVYLSLVIGLFGIMFLGLLVYATQFVGIF